MPAAALGPGCEVEKDLLRVEEALESSYSAETAIDPELWSWQNPYTGHADLASVMIAEKVGGLIFKGLSHDGKIIHYWNLLPNNTRYDATSYQFDEKPKWKYLRKVQIKAVMCDIGVKRRLLTFKAKFDTFYVDI